MNRFSQFSDAPARRIPGHSHSSKQGFPGSRATGMPTDAFDQAYLNQLLKPRPTEGVVSKPRPPAWPGRTRIPLRRGFPPPQGARGRPSMIKDGSPSGDTRHGLTDQSGWPMHDRTQGGIEPRRLGFLPVLPRPVRGKHSSGPVAYSFRSYLVPIRILVSAVLM